MLGKVSDKSLTAMKLLLLGATSSIRKIIKKETSNLECDSIHFSSMQVLHQGLSTRSVGVTGANQDSSRSHAIVQLTIKDVNDKEFSRLVRS